MDRFFKIIAVLFLFTALKALAEEKFTLKSPHLTSVLAIDVESGNEILSFSADEARIPASTMKVLTAISALKEVGSEYFFTTEFYLDRGALVVKGGGDSALVREDLWIIANKLKENGLNAVEKICVDASLYKTRTTRAGNRAYYASASSLAVDYNAEDISTGDEAVYRTVGDPILNFIELFYKILGQVGIKIEQQPKRCETKINGKLLYRFRSKPLREIINLMNAFSTNMIAESLVYLIGDWSYEKGLERMRELTKAKRAIIVDGSGLSRENRLTARELTNLLISAYKDADFNLEFLSSLPVGRKRGTLKERVSIPKHAVVRAKTGSLDGVITLAGFIQTNAGKMVAFAILQNEVRNVNRALEVEKNVLSYIYSNDY